MGLVGGGGGRGGVGGGGGGGGGAFSCIVTDIVQNDRKCRKENISGNGQETGALLSVNAGWKSC